MGQYTVQVNWTKDRIGSLNSPELTDSIQVATPPEFPGGVANIWSPEHLFVASVNSCFMTTFLAIAENTKLPFETFSSHAIGTLDKVEGKYMMTEITLYAQLKISDLSIKEKAARILEKSEAACLISNSVKSKVTLTYEIV